MRKHVVWSLVVLLCAGGMVGCKKEEVATTDTTAVAVDTAMTTGTSSSAKVGSDAAAAVTAGQVGVTVSFRGLVTHILAKGHSKLDRSVVLNDSAGHHPVYLVVPKSADVTALENATGVVPAAAGMEWKIKVRDPFSLRVVQWNGATATQYTTGVTADNTFKKLVPSVMEASRPKIMAGDLKGSLFGSAPSGSEWKLFYDLDFGVLSATSHDCKVAFFKHKLHDKLPAREFPAEVTQTGSVPGPVALQITRGTTVTIVPFTPALTSLAIRIEAESTRTGGSDFDNYRTLSAKALTNFDSIDDSKCEEDRDNEGPDPSCSNSTWP